MANKPSPAHSGGLSHAQAQLVESEERFSLLVESISDYAIFMLDPEGRVQSWNIGAQRLKGYQSNEIIGQHFSVFYSAEDRARRHPDHELEIATQIGRYEEEGWRFRKDGSRFWASVIITRLLDKQGNHVGFAKITRDLTARRETEERLKQSEERFRLLINGVKDYAIFMLDKRGYITTWNEGAARLKGYRTEEVLGRHFSIFYPPEDQAIRKPDRQLEEAVQHGRHEEENWRVRKDGSRFWAGVVISPVRNLQGELIGFTKVTRDMTERRALEEKLKNANELLERKVKDRTVQLEEAIRSRDEFLSICSHELRTPITSLKLQLQSAERQLGKSDPRLFHDSYVRFIASSNRQISRLTRLIDDMLDVSRVATGRFALHPEPVELCELVTEVVGRLSEQLRLADCKVELRCHPPIEVICDSPRIEQVLSNLLMNAIKYAPGKPIQIEVHSLGDQAVISISDQGIGIAPEDRERIFQRFERAISADDVSGLGLGLYVSKQIVEAHHGTISVQSELGQGSTFTIELPLRNA